MSQPGEQREGGGAPSPSGSPRALLRGLARSVDAHPTGSWIAVLGGALALRVAALHQLEASIYGRVLMPDEDTYHRWGKRIAGGTDAPGFAPDFPRLPAHVLGTLYSIFGASPSVARWMNVWLGVALCGLVYATGRSLYGRGAGLLAALLCALSTSLTFYSATLLHVSLGLVLLGVVLWLGAESVMRPERHLLLKLLGAGAASGLLSNVRANAALLGFLVLLGAIVGALRGAPDAGSARWHAPARLAAAFVAAYALCAALSGGLAGPRYAWNLYMGNNAENPTPYFRPVRFTSSAPEHQTAGFVVEASRRAGRTLDIGAAERFWTGQVVEGALAHPGAFATRLAQKALALVNASPTDNNHDLRVVGDFVPSLRLAFLPSWLLLALAFAMASVLPFDRRLRAAAIAALVYAATVVAFFAGERLRMPLLLIAAPVAGAGTLRLMSAEHAPRRRLALRAAAVFCVAALLAHVPLPGAADLSGPYDMHALMLLGEGDLDGAESWYRRSLELGENDSEGARIGLAAIFQKRGQLDDAVAILEPLPDDHYEAASKHEWLGNLALARKRPEDAVAAYRQAIAFDSSKLNAYRGLYVAYRMLGERAKADEIDAKLQRLRAMVP